MVPRDPDDYDSWEMADSDSILDDEPDELFFGLEDDTEDSENDLPEEDFFL